MSARDAAYAAISDESLRGGNRREVAEAAANAVLADLRTDPAAVLALLPPKLLVDIRWCASLARSWSLWSKKASPSPAAERVLDALAEVNR